MVMGARRVLRGGSWTSKPGNLRSANRARNDTGYRNDYLGFHLVQREQKRMRVIRGGSWRREARYCRCACRYGFDPDFRHGDLGFRLVQRP